MKQLSIFLFVFFNLSVFVISAQVVTTNPTYPTVDQSVIITFDISQAGCGLDGYTGDIYAHTGVLLEGVDNWQHVIESWGNNDTQPKLTNIGGGFYQLDTDSSINKFYGIEAGEVVTDMCFVFRSEDGTQQSGDIFIKLYQDDNIIFTNPDTTKIYPQGNININAAALFATDLTLYINDIEETTISDNVIDYNYNASTPGLYTVKISATDGSSTIEKETFFFVADVNNVADLPSTDLVDGINYISDTEVTLVLYAPNKDFAFVRGSFDEWEYSLSNQMNKTSDGKRYWITLSGLTPGEEYIYQFIVDGEIVIADPYTDKILDPWNDSYISSETYPGLIAYPEDKTSGIVSVFQTAQSEYTWVDNDFIRPDNDDLIIYELLVRDFVETHSYQTLIDTINYFKNLGVNAIELMPVNEFEGNSSWGYNPSFYFAPDKYYGQKDKLKEFIDLCHQNDIAVIMDIVLNHSYGLSPFVQLYFNPDACPYGQPTSENPWYNETSPNSSYSWGYDFNHESQDTKELVSRVVKYWLDEYRFDGFRFDFTKGFTNTSGDGWAYDAARIQILKDIADTIWTNTPGAYVILEHFTDNSEETVLADYGMMIWGNMTYSYGQAAMSRVTDWDFSWASYQERGWSNSNLISYMESHDEERMMYKTKTFGNSSGDYVTRDEDVALKRMEIAALFHFLLPGPKMIWQFEELGYDISIDIPCRVCEKPILWNYYSEKNRKDLYDYFSIFIDLKKNYEVFTTDDFMLDLALSVKQIKLNHSSMNAVIIGNFYLVNLTANPDLSGSDTWYDYYTQDVYDNTASFTLAPGEYKILTSVQLDTPDLPVSVKSLYSQESFIYPSIVKDYIIIDNTKDIETIQIFDMVGKLVSETKPSFNNRINISGLVTGFYLVKAVSSELIFTQKIFKQ